MQIWTPYDAKKKEKKKSAFMSIFVSTIYNRKRRNLKF